MWSSLPTWGSASALRLSPLPPSTSTFPAGQLESILFDGFLLWCIAVLLRDSRGGTRLFGAVILAIGAVAEIYAWRLASLGRSLNTVAPALKLFAIGVFIWLLLESRKPRGPLPSSIL
jgi:membrane associated rhomboid family serine protease